MKAITNFGQPFGKQRSVMTGLFQIEEGGFKLFQTWVGNKPLAHNCHAKWFTLSVLLGLPINRT